MRLQNIYDSIGSAIMRKVEESILNNDAYFSFGRMVTGCKASILKEADSFYEIGLEDLSLTYEANNLLLDGLSFLVGD